MTATDACTRVCTILSVMVAILVGLSLRASKQEFLDAVKVTAVRRSELEMRRLGEYLLQVASHDQRENVQHLRQLLERAPVVQRKAIADSVEVDGAAHKSALFLACLHRSSELVELLLWADANVSMGRLDEGTTPLHLAAGWRHDERIVELLLASRDRAGVIASLRAKPASGGLRMHTPIYWAAHYDYPLTRHKLITWMHDSGWMYDEAEDGFEIEQSRAWRGLAADY